MDQARPRPEGQRKHLSFVLCRADAARLSEPHRLLHSHRPPHSHRPLHAPLDQPPALRVHALRVVHRLLRVAHRRPQVGRHSNVDKCRPRPRRPLPLLSRRQPIRPVGPQFRSAYALQPSAAQPVSIARDRPEALRGSLVAYEELEAEQGEHRVETFFVRRAALAAGDKQVAAQALDAKWRLRSLSTAPPVFSGSASS